VSRELRDTYRTFFTRTLSFTIQKHSMVVPSLALVTTPVNKIRLELDGKTGKCYNLNTSDSNLEEWSSGIFSFFSSHYSTISLVSWVEAPRLMEGVFGSPQLN